MYSKTAIIKGTPLEAQSWKYTKKQPNKHKQEIMYSLNSYGSK